MEALDGHEVARPRHARRGGAGRLSRQGAARSARRSVRGGAERGIIVCGSGAGAAIAACKIAGIRAAICHDLYSAHQAVEHDDMNVLCLGSEIIGASVAARARGGVPRGASSTAASATSRGWRRWRRWKGDEGWVNRGSQQACRHGGSRSGSTCSRASSSTPGELQRMVDEDSVTGLTSNPSIFQKAIAGGGDYDAQIRQCLEETDDPRAIFFALAIEDVRDACDVLRPVWDAHGRRRRLRLARGRSRPRVRHRQRRFEQAVELHERVDRPNLYIKIPATREGLPAIEDCIARGIPINVTLIFSLERYAEVVAAYLRGVSPPHRSTAATRRRCTRSRRSSSRGSTPRPTGGSTELGQPGAAGQARASRTRGSPTAISSRRSPGPVWERLAAAGRDASSGRSGPRPRPRTPPTAT